MELNEALDTLNKAGFIAEGMGRNEFNADDTRKLTRYGNNAGASGYTYKSPTKDRMYIKILQQLLDGPKTKAEVHLALGLKDPTTKDDMGRANNYYTNVWQELRRAGLVDFERENGKVQWFITPRGMDLLDEANGLTEAKKPVEKIKTIDDVLQWLIAQGVVKPGECKKSDAEALWIPPAFDGDSAMTIRIFPDEDRLTITHATAGKFATRSLTYEALDKAWDKLTAAAY